MTLVFRTSDHMNAGLEIPENLNNQVKIYTDVSVIKAENRKNLAPPLLFHFGKREIPASHCLDHDIESTLTFCNDPEDADLFMLPMHWSYYLWNRREKMHEADRLAKFAKLFDKRVIIWHKGDLVPIIPFDNSLVFLPGIIKSRSRSNQLACPVFVEDPAPNFGQYHVKYREKSVKPLVGFCGYASARFPKVIWSILRGTQLNLFRRFNRSDYESFPILPSATFRARALRALSRSPEIDTRFIIREKYHGHRRHISDETALGTSNEFFSNIYETDYTLCLRGYGNWSYRFYETLACGRIPVFIDTDCDLPLSEKIDWKKYCVWIDRSEIRMIGERIADFHSSLKASEFIDLQLACRKLWQEHFTLSGFMQRIGDYLPHV